MNKKSTSVIVGLVCVAITVVSVFVTLNRNFLKIPIFNMVLGEAEVDRTLDEFDKYYEEFEGFSDEVIEEFEDETGLTSKKVEKFFKNPSLNGAISVGSKLEDFNMDDETMDMMRTIRTVLVVYGIVIALFSLMGALFKKKALTIIALVISIPFYIFIVGWLMFALFAIASIVHIIAIPKKEKAPVTPVQ